VKDYSSSIVKCIFVIGCRILIQHCMQLHGSQNRNPEEQPDMLRKQTLCILL